MTTATVWARLQEAGLAAAVCDSIVVSQPVPDRLLRALAKAPVVPALDVEPAQIHSGLCGFALTPKEQEVLDDAACGLTAEQTAHKRGRALDTVKKQRKQVLRKLGAVNMTHAVALSVRDVAA